MRVRFSLLALFGLITFTAIGIGAFTIRTRPMVALLSLATTLTVLFGILAAIVRRGESRTFWIGFAVLALGNYYWTGSVNREFYTIPGVIAEFCAGPSEIYKDYSRYDAMSGATRPRQQDINTATQDRVRFIGNQIATVYLGVLGGYVALSMAAKRPEVERVSSSGG